MAKRTPSIKPKQSDTLAGIIRQAIIGSGLTYYAVSKRAGVTPDTVSRFVSGEVPDMRISTAGKLCKALGLKLVRDNGPEGQASVDGG
jgi:transcriptional regulator with XRE-family HTH domain